jgi:hypothetical protein
MKLKTIFSLLLIMQMPASVFAQQDERLLYQDKRTIYSKLAGQEGSNINLTLQIYSNDKIKLVISCYRNSTENIDTVNIHELNYLPVQNLIVQKLISHSIGSVGQSVSTILESQSMSTINLMILTGQAFITSSNNVNRNNIESSFNFKVKVPIFILADSSNIQNLFRLVGYTKEQMKIDSTIIEDSLSLLNVKVSDLNANNNLTPKYADSLKVLSKQITDLRDDLSLFQFVSGKRNRNYYLVGFAFVNKNEIVVNNGFAKAMKMTLSDSIELRYRFGGTKVSLAKFGMNKIHDYNFSLDLRSVSAYQRSIEGKYLNKYIRIWSYSNNALKFLTKLSDLFEYNPPEDPDITEMFVSRTQRIIFNVKNPTVTKVRETDINTVIKLNLFTDLVGIQEDQPNGLVQAEGTFTTHLFGWGTQQKYRINNLYLFDHLEANLKFSKIENKLRYLDAGIIKGGDKVTFIPNYQLLQYSNLESGIKVSAFKFDSYKREFNLYGSLGVVRTGIRDTLFISSGSDTTKVPRTFNVLSFKRSIQAHLKIKATSYMGVDVSNEFIWLRLLDTDVKQSGGNYSRELNVFKEFRPKQNIIINPQFQVYYMPNKDESQRLYLRGAFFHDIGTKSNNYLTIQIGLSSDINKFLNFNKTN